MYKQFALTIAISVLLSAFNALTLTPALCAMLLQAAKAYARAAWSLLPRLQQSVRRYHQWLYERVTRMLVRRSSRIDRHCRDCSPRCSFLCKTIPAGFIPDEDQGILGVTVQLPTGASLERTNVVLKQVEEDSREDRGYRFVSDDRRIRRCHQHLPIELRLAVRAAKSMGGTRR